MVTPATLDDAELRKVEKGTANPSADTASASTAPKKPANTANKSHHRVFLTLIKVFLVYQVVIGHNTRYFEFLRNYFKVYVGHWLISKTLNEHTWAFGLKNELLSQFEKFQPFHMGYKLGTEYAMPGFMFISGYLVFYFMKSRRARGQSFFNPKPFAFWTSGLLSFAWEKFKRLVVVGFLAHILFNCTQGCIEIIPRVLEEGDNYPFLKDKLIYGATLFFTEGYWGRTNHLWFMVALLLFSFMEIPKGVLFSQMYFDKVKTKKPSDDVPLKTADIKKIHKHIAKSSFAEEDEKAGENKKPEKLSHKQIKIEDDLEPQEILADMVHFDNHYQELANKSLNLTINERDASSISPFSDSSMQEGEKAEKTPLIEASMELEKSQKAPQTPIQEDDSKNTGSESSNANETTILEQQKVEKRKSIVIQEQEVEDKKHHEHKHKHHRKKRHYLRRKKKEDDGTQILKLIENVLDELFPSVFKFFRSWGFGTVAIATAYIVGLFVILVLFMGVKWYYVSFFFVFPVVQIILGLFWVYCEYVWKVARKKAAILAIQTEIEEENNEEYIQSSPENEISQVNEDEEDEEEIEKLAKEEEKAKEKELITKSNLTYLEMPLPLLLRVFFFPVFGFQKPMWKKTPLHQYYWKFCKTFSLVAVILATIVLELFFYLEIWKPDLDCQHKDDSCQIADTLSMGIFSHYVYFDTGFFFAMFFHVFIELQESRYLSSSNPSHENASSNTEDNSIFCCYKQANLVYRSLDSIFWSILEFIQNFKEAYLKKFNVYVFLLCIVLVHFPLILTLLSPFYCPESFYFKDVIQSNIITKDNLKDMCPAPTNTLQLFNHFKCSTVCVIVRELRYDYFNEQFFNYAYNIHTYQDYYMRLLNLSRNWIWIFVFFYFFWLMLDFDIDSKETLDQFFYKNYITPFARKNKRIDILMIFKWWFWTVPNQIGIVIVRVMRDTAFLVYLMHSLVIFCGAMFMRYFLQISLWKSYLAVIATFLGFNFAEFGFLVAFGWLSLKIPIVAYLMKGQ